MGHVHICVGGRQAEGPLTCWRQGGNHSITRGVDHRHCVRTRRACPAPTVGHVEVFSARIQCDTKWLGTDADRGYDRIGRNIDYRHRVQEKIPQVNLSAIGGDRYTPVAHVTFQISNRDRGHHISGSVDYRQSPERSSDEIAT